MQLINQSASGPLYLTSGAGSKIRDDLQTSAVTDGSLFFGYGHAGFTSASLTYDALTLVSHDAYGGVLNTYVQRWSAKPVCGDGAVPISDARCGPAPPSVVYGGDAAAEAALAAAVAGDATAAPAPQFDQYQPYASLTLPGGAGWDYVTVYRDPVGQWVRVLCGRRGDGLTVLDASTTPGSLVVLATVAGTANTNGATVITGTGVAVSNNGKSNNATFFRLFDGAALGGLTFPAALGGPDSSVWQAASQTVSFTMTHAPSGVSSLAPYTVQASLLAPYGAPGGPTLACALSCPWVPAAVVPVDPNGGGLESPKDAGDAAGVWLALEGNAAVGNVNLVTGAVSAIDLRTSLCSTPTGFDLDSANNLGFVACRGGDLPGAGLEVVAPVFVVVNLTTRRAIYSSPVGGHVDGLVYLPPSGAFTGRVMMSLGSAATVLIFEQVTPAFYRPVEALATRPGAKTMAVDRGNRAVYAVAPSGTANLAGLPIDTSPDAEPFYPSKWAPGSYTARRRPPPSVWSTAIRCSRLNPPPPCRCLPTCRRCSPSRAEAAVGQRAGWRGAKMQRV